MSDQNIFPIEQIKPSAPPLSPTLPDDVNITSFFLKKICDCQRELENQISQYQNVSKK